jgi:hypothetical protein
VQYDVSTVHKVCTQRFYIYAVHAGINEGSKITNNTQKHRPATQIINMEFLRSDFFRVVKSGFFSVAQLLFKNNSFSVIL